MAPAARAPRRRRRPPPPGFLSVPDFADRYGVCRRTIERRINAGEIAVFRDGPQIVYVPESELARLFAEKTARAGEPVARRRRRRVR